MKAQISKVLKGHASAVYCLQIEQKEHRLFSGSSDQMVGAWDIEKLASDGFSIKLDAPVFSLEKSGELLFVGQGSGGVHVIDLLTRREIRHLKYHHLPVFRILTHSSRAELYFLGGDGILSIVDSSDFSLLWSLPISDDKLRSASLDSSGRNLFLGASDGYIRVLETNYYNVLFEIKAHEGGVYDMAWISTEELITVGRDGYIRIWRFADDQIVQKEAVPAHNFAIYSIDISPSGKYFATASRDKTVKIWNPNDLSHPLRIARKGPIGHTHSVNVVRWLRDDLLVSAGDDRDLHFWTILNS